MIDLATPDYSGRIILGVVCAIILISYMVWAMRDGEP